jgi:hypothetical protein
MPNIQKRTSSRDDITFLARGLVVGFKPIAKIFHDRKAPGDWAVTLEMNCEGRVRPAACVAMLGSVS